VSKTLQTVGVIAGVVALAATGVGAAAGAGLFAAKGSATALAIAGTAKTVASYASIAAIAANVGASVTAQKPPARGSTNVITIGANQGTPCVLGRTYYGGNRVHQIGYGPTLNKVPNPYLLLVDVLSIGPIDGIEGHYADFSPIGFSGNAATGYFNGFLWRSTQLGSVPETSALALQFAGAPGWSAAHKLSGLAAVAWNAKFDKDGKVFASGFPQTGTVLRGVKCYDPRLDSTYPGGSGSCRLDNPTTWPYTENPGLHGLQYALGRYQAGKLRFGIGLDALAIRIGDFVHLANVCDANGWKVGGTIFEPGDRWANLKRILECAAAEPLFNGAMLGVRVSAPRVALDTIGPDDLGDAPVRIGIMQGFEQRINTLVPTYRSEPHKWEYVPSDPVQIATYLAEDGEEKREERRLELVQNKDQAAQVCAYEMLDARELGDIELPLMPRFRDYGPGDMLTINLPRYGLSGRSAIILQMSFDPATMQCQAVLRTDDPAKHAFALGRTGTAPPTPAIGGPEGRDDVASPLISPPRAARRLVAATVIPVTAATETSITLQAFDAVTEDGEALSLPAATLTGLEGSKVYALFWNPSSASYVAAPLPATEQYQNPGLIFLVRQSTSDSGGTFPTFPTPPPGYGGGGNYYEP
jgi:hypothetical protein